MPDNLSRRENPGTRYVQQPAPVNKPKADLPPPYYLHRNEREPLIGKPSDNSDDTDCTRSLWWQLGAVPCVFLVILLVSALATFIPRKSPEVIRDPWIPPEHPNEPPVRDDPHPTPVWEELHRGRCVWYGTRQYYAHLATPYIEYPADRLEACEITPMKINGRWYEHPDECHDKGRMYGVFGYWNVPSPEDSACLSAWSPVVDEGCTQLGSGYRKWSARLENVHEDEDLHAMCETTPINFNGHYYMRPMKCESKGWPIGVYGIWEIQDSTCDVHDPPSPPDGHPGEDPTVIGEWQEPPAPGQCVAYSTRQYSAHLFKIPWSWAWLEACWSSSNSVSGHFYRQPHDCRHLGYLWGVYGYWNVKDDRETECMTTWGPLNQGMCTYEGSGHRFWSARLENVRNAENVREMCETTPIQIFGMEFTHPAHCESIGDHYYGRWEIPDYECDAELKVENTTSTTAL